MHHVFTASLFWPERILTRAFSHGQNSFIPGHSVSNALVVWPIGTWMQRVLLYTARVLINLRIIHSRSKVIILKIKNLPCTFQFKKQLDFGSQDITANVNILLFVTRKNSKRKGKEKETYRRFKKSRNKYFTYEIPSNLSILLFFKI